MVSVAVAGITGSGFRGVRLWVTLWFGPKGVAKMNDDNEPRKRPAFEMGMSLDAMSVDELHDHIGELENEIDRLRVAIAAKTDSLFAADAVFKN
jgi:uncharacterized small protein (DUF1192 family)